MVVQGIPVLKLTGLIVKSLAKPISRQVKRSANEFAFMEKLCVNIGRGTNYVVRRLTHFTSVDFARHKYKHVEISRPDALKNGAEMVSETFVLGTVATVTLLEYSRQNEKKLAEEKRRRAELEEHDAVQDARLSKQNERISALEIALKENNTLLQSILLRLSAEDTQEGEQ
uniref:Optic atrophy 3 protein n=1 Tax=Aureoumbra lagunensis TaxID=44058 RepID=A0A7S3JZQ4_9STRA|mmetsp:Transcript_20637/g.26724  ORF Transcript_20637/g.26724 Transcript_20637/m.26724 type:complete len:171 (+) Transcript_20637:87-599(+)